MCIASLYSIALLSAQQHKSAGFSDVLGGIVKIPDREAIGGILKFCHVEKLTFGSKPDSSKFIGSLRKLL